MGLAARGVGPVLVVADVLLLLAVLVDWVRTPSPELLDVRRSVAARAGLSQDLARVARIDVEKTPAAGGLELELREEFPMGFEVRARTVLTEAVSFEPHADEGRIPGTVKPLAGDPTGGPDAVRLPKTGPIDLVRVYRSSRRGVHELGDLRLRLRGRLGLVQRQARLAGVQEVAVEPALAGLRRTLKLAASERWVDLGVRKLRRRGGMMEFESLRDHVPGDDVRKLDWKAFAKRGRPTVREFQEERGQELILCFDCGRRMGATTDVPVDVRRGRSSSRRQASRNLRGWSKLDHALDAGLELAAVALSRGDRVGLMAFDAGVLAWQPPARGAAQLRRLRESVFALQPSTLDSDLARALRELALRHRRSAMLVILSDVADPLSVERQARALAGGSRRHKIVFAGLDDPSLRLAAAGAIQAPAMVRAAALEEAEERRRGLARLARPGLRVIDTLPAEAAGPLLGAWLEERRSG